MNLASNDDDHGGMRGDGLVVVVDHKRCLGFNGCHATTTATIGHPTGTDLGFTQNSRLDSRTCDGHCSAVTGLTWIANYRRSHPQRHGGGAIGRGKLGLAHGQRGAGCIGCNRRVRPGIVPPLLSWGELEMRIVMTCRHDNNHRPLSMRRPPHRAEWWHRGNGGIERDGVREER